MRVSCILLVAAASFLVNCNAEVSDSTNLMKMMPGHHSNKQRLLRDYDSEAANEERAFSLKSAFDVRKWLGLKDSNAATAALKLEKDFSMQTIANALNSKKAEKKLFKKWDKYTMDQVNGQVGQYMKHDSVRNLLEKYVTRRANAKLPM